MPSNARPTSLPSAATIGLPELPPVMSVVAEKLNGNIHSIAGDYWFDESMNRTVGVNTAIMLEALETVYGADHLIEELTVID